MTSTGGRLEFEVSGNTYTLTLHPPGEGLAVSLKLASMLTPLLGRLVSMLATDGLSVEQVIAELQRLAAAQTEDPDDMIGELEKTFVRVFGHIGKDQIGPLPGELSAEIARVLSDDKLPAYLVGLFRYTSRNGEALVSRRAHGGVNQAAFDAAFAGNYSELYLAAFQVIKANGFFPVPGIS